MKFRHFRHALSVFCSHCTCLPTASVHLFLCEGVCEQVMWPWPEGHWKPSVPFSSPDIPSILTATSPAVNSEKQRAGSLAGLLGTLPKLFLPVCRISFISLNVMLQHYYKTHKTGHRSAVKSDQAGSFTQLQKLELVRRSPSVDNTDLSWPLSVGESRSNCKKFSNKKKIEHIPIIK